MVFISKEEFNLSYKRQLLYKRKKRRKNLITTFIITLPLAIIFATIFIIMSNKNKTIATFNLAIPKVSEKPPYVVCIDPGHGDWDFGAIGITGAKEKDIALSVSLKLGKLLEEEGGFKVIYTRSTDTIDWVQTANDSLKERIKVSKVCNANIFISIHCNYSTDSKNIAGVETWYNPSDENSLMLSNYLQQGLIDLSYTKNRGVKSYIPGEELAVLELNTTTSSLVELGFLTNYEDEKYLSSDFGQKNCANALFEAIVEFRDAFY